MRTSFKTESGNAANTKMYCCPGYKYGKALLLNQLKATPSQFEYNNIPSRWKKDKKNPLKKGQCDIYLCDFIDGERTGKGIFHFSNGVKFRGEWSNGTLTNPCI